MPFHNALLMLVSLSYPFDGLFLPQAVTYTTLVKPTASAPLPSPHHLVRVIIP